MEGDSCNMIPGASVSSSKPEGRGEGMDIHLSPEFVQQLLKQMAPEVAEMQQQIERLKEEKSYISDMFITEGIKVKMLTEENERLRRQIAAKEAEKGNGTQGAATDGNGVQADAGAEQPFLYFIDTRRFVDMTERRLVELWDLIFTFTQPMEGVCNGKPLIDNASAIAPLYIILSDKHVAHRFIGNRDDFAYMWNRNVAARVDNYRRPGLTCKQASLTATLNREPWKGAPPALWGRLSLEGTKYSDRYIQAKAMMDRLSIFLI